MRTHHANRNVKRVFGFETVVVKVFDWAMPLSLFSEQKFVMLFVHGVVAKKLHIGHGMIGDNFVVIMQSIHAQYACGV